MRPLGKINSANDAAKDTITAIFARLEDGFHRQDADIFDSDFAQDAVQVTAAGQRMSGWDTIHQYHKERLEGHAHGLRVVLKVDSIGFLTPAVAIVHTLQETTTGDGDVRRNSGTWTLAERDDKWWICAVQQTNVVDLAPGWDAHSGRPGR